MEIHNANILRAFLQKTCAYLQKGKFLLNLSDTKVYSCRIKDVHSKYFLKTANSILSTKRHDLGKLLEKQSIRFNSVFFLEKYEQKITLVK